MKAYMALTCNVGCFNPVLEELSNLNIPKEDIFSLFGPIDILIQFWGSKTVDQFVENWFNRVRMIGSEKSLIKDTQTFIVISEERLYGEEPFAFLFLNTKPKDLDEVRKAIQNIPEVLSIDVVFGPYDIICPIKVNNKEELEKVIADIRTNIQGITNSMTAIVAVDRFSHLSFG